MSLKPTSTDNLPATRRACGNCGRLGHLTRTCSNPAKAHVKLGIEIEGYWRCSPGDTEATVQTFRDVQTIAERWHMRGDSDGSLNGYADYEAWEFKTRPGSLGEAISQLIAVYPHATAACCGMHVHVSFAHLTDISALCTPEFFRYFGRRWEEWGARMELHPNCQFWSRLRGENRYCQRNLGFSSGREITRHDRYRALNFSSWERHKTVECRMLPMFRDARLGVLAVEELVGIFEDYLQSLTVSLDRSATLEADRLPRALPEGMIENREVTLNLPSLGPEFRPVQIDAPQYPPLTPGFVRIPYASYGNYLAGHIRTAETFLDTAMQEVV